MNQRGFSMPTCTDRADAERLYRYSCHGGDPVQLIAIHSPYLGEVYGRASWTESDAVSIGFDVVPVGEWSLLCAVEPLLETSASQTARFLNTTGLLDDAASAPLVEREYRLLAAQGIVDDFAPPGTGLPVESLEVFEFPSL